MNPQRLVDTDVLLEQQQCVGAAWKYDGQTVAHGVQADLLEETRIISGKREESRKRSDLTRGVQGAKPAECQRGTPVTQTGHTPV